MILDKPNVFDGNKLADELTQAGITVTGLVLNNRNRVIEDDRFFIEGDKLRFGFEVPIELQEIAIQVVASHNG